MRKDHNLEREIRRGWHKSYLRRYGEDRFLESFPLMHAYLKRTKRLRLFLSKTSQTTHSSSRGNS